MAPKSKSKDKKNKNDKKNKSGEGTSCIAPGLIPNTAFAVVPRTPPPTLDAEDVRESVDLDLSSGTGVLRASAMGRLFSNPPLDDVLSEETDTSLFDYEQARGTLSGAGGMGSLRQGMGGERPPAPPPGFDDDTDEEPLVYDPIYSEVRVERDVSPMYSTPIRKQPLQQQDQRRSTGSFHAADSEDEDENSAPPNSSMRRFQRDDAAQLRDSRGSRGSRNSQRSSLRTSMHLEERVESMMVNSQSSPAQSMHSTERSVRDASIGVSSQRLATLSAQSMKLATQQGDAEAKADEDANRQRESITKLLQAKPEAMENAEITELLQETQSVASASLRSQGEVTRTYQRRVELLEKEKRELTELNNQMQGELNSMHRMASFRENNAADDLASTQTGLLKKQLQDLKDDSTTLKSTIHRLNTELSRYQAQYRTITDRERNELPGLPLKGPKPSWLLNTKLLAPLFVAYDDRLAQKDSMLRQYERDIDNLAGQVEDVIKENQRLHLRLEQADPAGGPHSMTEWRQLQEQCKLVLEENQLLMEQLDIQHAKQRDMHHANMQEVTRLSKQVVETETTRTTVERELELMRRECTVIKERHEGVVESNTKLTAGQTAQQLARELDDEQIQHQQSLTNLRNRLETLTSDKKSLQIQVDDLKTENKTMNGDIKALYKAQRKSHRKILLLQKALEDAESKEYTAEHYLSTVVKMAEKTELERDTFAQAAHKEGKQKKKVITRLLKENNTVTRMEDKLKLYKVKVVDKLERAADRLKEQDDGFNQQRREYEREIQHLRLLLRERDEQLHTATGDKRQVEDDLETMWQVASKDNRQMKHTLRKIDRRKLMSHEEGFRGDNDDDDDEVMLLLKDPGDRLLTDITNEDDK